MAMLMCAVAFARVPVSSCALNINIEIFPAFNFFSIFLGLPSKASTVSIAQAQTRHAGAA